MASCCLSHSRTQTDIGALSSLNTAPKTASELNFAFVHFERTDGRSKQMVGHKYVDYTAPKGRLRRVGTRGAYLKEIWEVDVGRRTLLKDALFLATSKSGSSWRVYAKECRGSLSFSEAAAVEAEVRVETMMMNPVVATNLITDKDHNSAYLTKKTLGIHELNLAGILDSISELYTEVGEDSRQAAEYLQDVEEEGKGLRTTSDYNRRAYLYGRVAEIVKETQKKGERVFEDLEQLQEVVMGEDKGRAPADYMRRAEIFSKSAEVFGSEPKEVEEK